MSTTQSVATREAPEAPVSRGGLYILQMPQPTKSVLWVDDEAELLEPHRMFLRDKGFEVESATNADDAVEMVRRRPFNLVLLDEQMPGKRGMDVLRELREADPNVAIVMVTKSEEDATMTEALGADLEGYLVKPVTPRQVFAAVTRLIEGPRIRQQAIARRFVDRFRDLQNEPIRGLSWKSWIERFGELTQWDLDLVASNEMGLHESLQGLYPDLRREFALFMKTAYPGWLKNLEGDRPPLSIDIVPEFLLPILKTDRAAVFIVIDCLRLDQWRALEPIISPLFDVETTHYFSVLPTATPFSRNALFSGLFPGEIAARFPDWWGEREDETLNAHERDLLEAQLAELQIKAPVRYEKVSTSAEGDDIERRLPRVIAADGISAFVFNFVDLLTHGRSESAILYEVARDEIALRQLTLQWFRRSPLFSVLQEAARRKVKVLVTSDHGSIHCRTPATVFAKRDATQNLRYKFGEDLRAENPEQGLLFTNEDSLKLPRRGMGANTLLATGDSFFVYPTKLREYQSRYRGSFLHGGVTPEECILPVALLTPRR
jgi:DNA-binding NarL/FixJ family response regulator